MSLFIFIVLIWFSFYINRDFSVVNSTMNRDFFQALQTSRRNDTNAAIFSSLEMFPEWKKREHEILYVSQVHKK